MGTTPKDVLNGVALYTGQAWAVPIIEGATAVIDTAKNILKGVGLDFDRYIVEIGDEMARKLGKRTPRFRPEQLTTLMNDITNRLVKRNVSEQELITYFDPLIYGYLDLAYFENDIKNTSEYKTLQAIPVIENLYQSITGNMPDKNTLVAWTAKYAQGWTIEQLKSEIAWQAIKQTQLEILGREPTETNPEDNYWYNLWAVGRRTVPQIRIEFLNSEEYKLTHPSPIKKALPYVVGAGIVISLL